MAPPRTRQLTTHDSHLYLPRCRSGSRGGARKEEGGTPSFNKMLSPAPTLPGKGASSPFIVSARA